jgi:hypothetical protein
MEAWDGVLGAQKVLPSRYQRLFSLTMNQDLFTMIFELNSLCLCVQFCSAYTVFERGGCTADGGTTGVLANKSLSAGEELINMAFRLRQ